MVTVYNFILLALKMYNYDDVFSFILHHFFTFYLCAILIKVSLHFFLNLSLIIYWAEYKYYSSLILFTNKNLPLNWENQKYMLCLVAELESFKCRS